MLLIIGDVHGQFQVINEQIMHAETHCGCHVDAVIVLGDMGIFVDTLRRFFVDAKQRFMRPVYFVDGNHEEFSCFESLTEEYREFFTWLPRGRVTEIFGRRFLSLGGACYMDALNSPCGSEILDHDIDLCLRNPSDTVDMIVTHDCPAGIGVPGTPGFEFYGTPGFARSQELVAHFRPCRWFFGHHHRWFHASIAGTDFHGLPESWKGFGLLDENMNYQRVENSIRLEPDGWLRRLLRFFTG